MVNSAQLPSEDETKPSTAARYLTSVTRTRVLVPVGQLEGFVQVFSLTQPNTQIGSGRHTFEYRSTLGSRISVSVTSQITEGSFYSRTDPRDHHSANKRVWRHNGAIPTGELGWQRSSAVLEVTHAASDASLPSAQVDLSVRGDAPYSEPRSFGVEIPLT